jgi:hypothetical protein
VSDVLAEVPVSAPDARNGNPEAASARRVRKFRQAAFVYLHVGALYEAAVVVAWRGGHLTLSDATIAIWLGVGAAIVAVVFWALWSKHNAWVARIIWLIGLARLPFIIERAFVEAVPPFSPLFYMTALVIILVNLAFLARAGWDL